MNTSGERAHASQEMKRTIIWLLLGVALSIGILALPLDTLEYLSLNVVGEPPINGKTWTEGMMATGGEWGMKAIGIAGLLILILGILFIARIPFRAIRQRTVKNTEIFAFALSFVLFTAVNIWIGYRWWDPGSLLGMGPMFAHSIAALIVFGLLPTAFGAVLGVPKDGLLNNFDGIKQSIGIIVVIAAGYGLWSSLWHCCSFYIPDMFFFFFVTKLIQLWAMSSFFFKWAFPMLVNRLGITAAYIAVSVCFGIAYPWHTPGFAVAFTLFGIVLCDITRRTGSYLAPMLLLYFAYIFHAGAPWHGYAVSVYGILPAASAVLVALVGSYIKTMKHGK
ncbi:MAG TPA: CPBP family intramembrane metalloprotease [bacterium]|nr:CPBP family intramembrane metalloprotease [bacterium]